MGNTYADGFSILSLPHAAALLIIAALCVAGSLIYRKLSRKHQDLAGIIICAVIVVLDLIHYYVFYRLGELSLNAIPLHLCALAVYICFFHSIFRKDFTGQVLYDLCLPGAWCALIFPDWTWCPFFSYMSLHSFIVHGLIVIYITMEVASGRIRPRLQLIWKPIIFICIHALVALAVNRHLGTNFLFLSFASPGSPLEFLMKLAGGSHLLYLLFFGILALIVMTIMYIPFSIRGGHRKR